MTLTIIFPAFNEEERIGQTLDKYLSFYKDKFVDFIIIVNGCTDKTETVVREYGEKFPDKIDYIVISEEIGKGGAVRRGFQIAKGDLISFIDADASTEPPEFDRLVRKINGVDGAIASRWKKGSKIVNGNLFREIISLGFIAFVKVLFWMPVIDTQCGAKVFKKKVIKAILPQLRVNNMAFDVELLYTIRRAGFRVIEVPSKWEDNSSSSAMLGSPSKVIKNSINMFFTLLRIRLMK
ncbi:glycosyltransferase [Patescibacteria group bacterium]|nr:glycosyltransferase [Patescibacteria group bacterium]MBU0963415.1 glycosyltransferase [Patescibacteria group bacterium]